MLEIIFIILWVGFTLLFLILDVRLAKYAKAKGYKPTWNFFNALTAYREIINAETDFDLKRNYRKILYFLYALPFLLIFLGLLLLMPSFE